MKKKFNVAICYTCYSVREIVAGSEDEALEIALDMDADGVDWSPGDFERCRENDVVEEC